ncbi:MAG: DUF1538 domain-containing protein [Rhodospirillales bacterium]|nr:DUF1538 domain-containing protein [Rhodospirillales bacterium]
MSWIATIAETLGATLFDVLPIVAILFGFQVLVLRRRLPNPRRILLGFVYAVLGLALFLVGLEEALFPLGRIMAEQLTAHAVEGLAAGAAAVDWRNYAWVYAFAAAVGFATTVAEPALIAVSLKASEVSGAALNPWGLRVAVALGVAFGVTLGVFRIVTGTPLSLYISAGYVFVVLQTFLAPRSIVPLAYDSGGVTTSTVTVPLVTALGLGLASTIPGRSPLIDGFGLIAFASLFPMITVMGYAQIGAWRARRLAGRAASKEDSSP